MSKINNNFDFATYEAQNIVLQNLAAAPAHKAGRTYFDTALGTLRSSNGTTWRALDATLATGIPLSALAVDPLARANHTGTQTASTISDFATTAQSYRLNQFAVPTAAVSFNGQELTNLGTPTVSTSAAPKSYVDTAVANATAGLDVKASARIATTANIALTGNQTIDGVTTSSADRVLVKNQTVASENGIYAAATGAWSRTADAVTGTLTSEAFVFIEEGTLNSGTSWRLTNSGAITTGTTALSFAQFGAATSYTPGNGISITGNTIAAVPAPSGGLTVSASGLAVDTAVVARKFAQTVGDGTSTSIAVTHNLGTQDVQVAVRLLSTNAWELVDWVATNTTTVTLTFGTAPATGTYRVAVIG